LKATRIAIKALVVAVVIAIIAAGYGLIFASHRAAERDPIENVARDVCARDVVDPDSVSIAALLANPDKFDGTPVRVIGFYHGSFEHSAIYFSQNDFRHNIHSNGLWVSGSIPSSLNGQYILVEGIFSSNDKGHLGLWSGTICNVARAGPWSRGPN
jgi:hypothetical protein